MGLFPEYLVTNPKGETEYLSTKDFAYKMTRYSASVRETQRYKDWCDAQGVLPALIDEIDGVKVWRVNSKQLMAYLKTAGYKFEEI